MLAGVWLLALLPLMDVYKTFYPESIPVPTVFDYRGNVQTLEDTFLSDWGVYESLIFCTGVVLLFSKERGRRAGGFDWTRRWGVISSYVLSLLAASGILPVCAMVLGGVAAVFMSMPLKYHPPATQWFIDISYFYLKFGMFPKAAALPVMVAFSSLAILLVCVALFDALRSCAPKWLAMTLVVPLAIGSAVHLVKVGIEIVDTSSPDSSSISRLGIYFWPSLMVEQIKTDTMFGFFIKPPTRIDVAEEFIKWGTIVAIAIWLSVAQLATFGGGMRSGRTSRLWSASV